MAPLKLMAVLAHPDDESLGVGGTLAKYSGDGVETSVVVATRGQRGRYYGHRDPPEHPGPEALGRIREAELRDAARVLGVRDLTILDYLDQDLDRADPREAITAIAREIRRVRPHVLVTFPPDGAYGHPDHIAISQFAMGAAVAAADASLDANATIGAAHRVEKLYYIAWAKGAWDAYQQAFRQLVSHVDGVERQAGPWPDWAITTVIDTTDVWARVWDAVSCHRSQVAAYERLRDLPQTHHQALWGHQSFYRVFSLVNGGRQRERDLFEGLR